MLINLDLPGSTMLARGPGRMLPLGLRATSITLQPMCSVVSFFSDGLGEMHVCSRDQLAAFLLTKILSPILQRTASLPSTPAGSVRVTWPASMMVENSSPKHGVRKEFLSDPEAVQKLKISPKELYASTKAACYFLASEYARRQPETGGVVHLAGNPGNYVTGMWLHVCLNFCYIFLCPHLSCFSFSCGLNHMNKKKQVPALLYACVRPILRDPSPHGADTWLWMGFSEEVTLEAAASGRYAMCDGRWHPGQRSDIVSSLLRVDEGGSGRAHDVYAWCEDQVAAYLS